MCELPEHPWFVACQFHPEFKSKPMAPHPLFVGFVRAGLAHQDRIAALVSEPGAAKGKGGVAMAPATA